MELKARQKVFLNIVLILEVFLSVISLQPEALQPAQWEYAVDIPVLKYFFALTEHVGGGGIENAALLLGIAAVFFYAGREVQLQKNRYLSVLAACFGIFTVFGRSYADAGSWVYVFGSKVQFVAALLVMAGYYFVYKNAIVMCLSLMKKMEPCAVGKGREDGKITRFVFEKHPFGISLAIFAVAGVPYLICFFPGTMEWDSFSQLATYYNLQGSAAHYPLVSTMLMGKCMDLGRLLFHSDAWGIFFYTGPQYVIQWLIFAYCIYVIGRVMKGIPTWTKWFSLLFLAFFPLWQIWGFTLCKDVYYYLGMLLWVTAMVHILVSEGKIRWWQWFLAAAGVLGITVSRKDGVYLLLFFAAAALLLCIGRRVPAVQVKLYGLCTAVAVVATILIQTVYMPMKGVENGPVREMLSIPLQQTARYVSEHGDELTSREEEIMEELFGEEWRQLREVYKPELSDPVKERFLYRPTSEELSDYAWLWWQGLKKHPGTYVQAFFNHVYGYFYPNAICSSETRATYLLGGMAVHYTWDGMDIWFAIENREVRDLFEAWAEFVYQLPCVGLLGSCGIYTYLYIGCFAYLMSKRKGRQSFLLLPALGTLLIAMISPVGTCVRYTLPVMALLPLNLAWCIYHGSTETA